MRQPGICVLFDKDGVLLNSVSFHSWVFREVYRQYFGCTLTDELLDVGHGRPLNECVVIWNKALGLDITYHDYDQHVCQFIVRPECDEQLFGPGLAPDLCDFLDHLRYWNVPVAVVTSNVRHEVVRRFDRLNLWRWFERHHVITQCDLTTPPKPHPGPFLMAAQRLNVPPERCIVIGDSATDIDGAHAANMAAIGFTGYLPPERRQTLAHAQRVVQSFAELSIPVLRHTVGLHPTAW